MKYFNTSHVVVYLADSLYRAAEIKFQYISCCSLSRRGLYTASGRAKFQYISCCSLSSRKSCQTKIQVYFNTSHVVVYLISKVLAIFKFPISIHLMLQFIILQYAIKATASGFQYISCCSLSILLLGLMPVANPFQYISCCSLSRTYLYQHSTFLHFNTSHVVVYLYNYVACCHKST